MEHSDKLAWFYAIAPTLPRFSSDDVDEVGTPINDPQYFPDELQYAPGRVLELRRVLTVNHPAPFSEPSVVYALVPRDWGGIVLVYDINDDGHPMVSPTDQSAMFDVDFPISNIKEVGWAIVDIDLAMTEYGAVYGFEWGYIAPRSF